MLSALLRPFKGSSSQAEDHPDPEHDPAFRPSVAEYRNHPHATADFTEADDDDDEESNDGEQHHHPFRGRPGDDEDGPARSSGLLPLFAANQLDSLPIYSMTHAIRIIVQTRTETTLTWEQLRSPQVSQFLVKPMLQQIRTQHFSRGTLYALLANCLQFEKEGQLCLGNAGTSNTRARVCELLAIKLLKEYTPRELIDALCYDFYPLQGIPGSQTPLALGGRPKSATLRTSALEVAIRASAKQFLSHPLIAQQLEAIWTGAITFPSSRGEPKHRGSASSAVGSNQSRRQSTIRTPLLGDQRAKDESARLQAVAAADRRSVTLYDPRTASLFKLSRLRVPRYRRLLSTCSLVVLVCLFLAVLAQRSSKITTLELFFWFWSAGFMLDDLVGFDEEGFSFYAMSFWNIFDLGLLLLLIVYYCMRIYGVFLLDPHKWNQNAYDVLAVNAILLLPRIFGMLNHYRHFSKLLICLRLLASDLAAVFVLALTFCSGFFAFFAFSKNPDDASTVAYKMFQMLVGFTPSAWEMWPTFNWMGKTLLVLFLVISHFVIITLLVVVLANSFMSIASRAAEEYQFAFAINAISMAKNDALFSYVAPGNIFAWALMPFRYCMSMDQYVWLNRAVIRITHFPVLFCIYIYEKLFLAPDMYEATDLVDRPHRGRHRSLSDQAFFSPSARVREESVLRHQKDQALEEVFRRAPDMRTQRRAERRKTQTAIRSWMDQHDGKFHSPQNYSTIDSRLSSDWLRRLSMNRERPSRIPKHYSDVRSTASDPADFIFDAPHVMAAEMYDDRIAPIDYSVEPKVNTDGEADGDDELVTNDEDEGDDVTNTMDDQATTGEEVIVEDYFTTPVATRFSNTDFSEDSPRPATLRRVPLHTRTLSTNTILYAPEEDSQAYSSSSASARPFPRPLSTRQTPIATPVTPGTGRRSPRRSFYLPPRPRSMVQPPETVPRANLTRGSSGLRLYIPTAQQQQQPPPPRRRSLADLLVTTSAEDSYYNTAGLRHSERRSGNIYGPPVRSNSNNSNSTATAAGTDLNKLMLARMHSLEQSMGCMVREMRTLRRRKSMPDTVWNSDEGGVSRRGGGGGSWERHQQHHNYQQQHRHQQQRSHERQGRYHHQQQQQHPSRAGIAGSDPSSVVSAGQSLIEIAAAAAAAATGRDRERISGGGASGKRTRGVPPGTSVATTPNSRRTAAAAVPGGKEGGSGAWRSPREEGAPSTAAAGLGIQGSEEGRIAKGKEKESVGDSGNDEHAGGSEIGVSPRTRIGLSSDRDGVGDSHKGLSL